MKLIYEKQEGVVAAIYKIIDNPSHYCLCIKTEKKNSFIWIYPNLGKITVQSKGFPDNKPVKEFREGDSITITF